jgi:hypothetical protein
MPVLHRTNRPILYKLRTQLSREAMLQGFAKYRQTCRRINTRHTIHCAQNDCVTLCQCQAVGVENFCTLVAGLVEKVLHVLSLDAEHAAIACIHLARDEEHHARPVADGSVHTFAPQFVGYL